MIAHNIISTGSKGNAVVIDNSIMIDCGVPYRALKDAYKSLALVLLTHEHKDHINPRTVKKLAQERPTLRWGCCEWMVGHLLECGVAKAQIDVYTPGFCFVYTGFCTIKPDQTIHNVPNCAYHIWQGDKAIFYATDTNSLEGIEAQGYDLYMVEANYTEDGIMERIRRKQEAGEYCYEWDVLQNHLSHEKAMDFIYKNIGANGEYVLLHQHEEENMDAK